MKLLFLSILLFSTSPSYAMELHNATILDHKSEVTGADSTGHVVDGHIEDCKNKSFINALKNHFQKKENRVKCQCHKGTD